MIIEIKNELEKRRKKAKKIRSLWDIILPEKYYLENNEREYLELRYKLILNTDLIANINLEEDVIIVSFEDEEELNKLKSFFKDSKTKFKLVVDGSYY